MENGQAAAVLSKDDLPRLLAFHAAHFPYQDPPQLSDAHCTAEEEEDDGLGYYEDGVKRTLTDEQIKMFRHSEIQRLLREQRWWAEASQDGSAMSNSTDNVEQKTAKKLSSCDNEENEGINRLPKNFHFYDEPSKSDAHNLSLSYSDEVEAKETRNSECKEFLWPKLG